MIKKKFIGICGALAVFFGASVVSSSAQATVINVVPRTNDSCYNDTDRQIIKSFFESKILEATTHSGSYYETKEYLIFLNSLNDAIGRGVDLESGMHILSVSKEDAVQHSTGYEEVMASLRDGEEPIAFFNSNVSLSSDNLLHTLGFGYELGTPITIKLPLPDDYKEVDDASLAVLRSHYDSEYNKYVVDRLEFNRVDDDLLAQSDKFSSFIITYTTPSSAPASPETGVITRVGGSATVASLITAIFVGITASVLSFAYLMNRKNR